MELYEKLSRISLSNAYNTSASNIGGIIWPGESIVVPRGWRISSNGRPLRIGIPVKIGFDEFVKLDLKNNTTYVSGYSIDVFNLAMKALPYDVAYEFIPFGNPLNDATSSYYDILIQQVYLHQKFDAVVGDVTIMPNRSLYVDFTLPYTETGVLMIVRIKEEEKKSWIFLKPLTKEMWLATLAAFIFTGCIIWVFEHRINTKFRGSPMEQLGMIFWFSFSTIVFAHRERVRSNLSRLVLIIWVFVVLILTSSYTASLSSTLTVQQLAVGDINQLIRNGDYVGYQLGSYVKGTLTRLHLDESKLRAYTSPEEYAEALLRGSEKGGVAAVFDEVPYVKLFLSKYCDKYAMVGPTYYSNGFGFVFRKGSPLALDVSNAILKINDEGQIARTDSNWFGNQTSCQNQGSTESLNSY